MDENTDCLSARAGSRFPPKVETTGYFDDTKRLVLGPRNQRRFDLGGEFETMAERELPSW